MNQIIIGGALVSITALWLLRVGITGNIMHGFIVWNIFLATIPLYVEWLFSIIRRRFHGVWQTTSQLIIAGIWLLFLPNAFYILTDFMHLNPAVLVNARNDNYRYATEYVRGDSLYMIDALLIFMATAFGAYVGGLALIHAYHFFQKRLSRLQAQISIVGIMLLSGLGVYIGRFGRWNSWDAVIFPHRVLQDTWNTFALSPIGRERILVIMLCVVALEIISMIVVSYHKKQHSDV